MNNYKVYEDKEAKKILNSLNNINQELKNIHNHDNVLYTCNNGKINFRFIEGQLPSIFSGIYNIDTEDLFDEFMRNFNFTINSKEFFAFKEITKDEITRVEIEDYNYIQFERVSGTCIKFNYVDISQENSDFIRSKISGFELFSMNKMNSSDIKVLKEDNNGIHTININEDGYKLLPGNAYVDLEGCSTTMMGKFLIGLSNVEKKVKITPKKTEEDLRETYKDWDDVIIKDYKVKGVPTPHLLAKKYSEVVLKASINDSEDLILLTFLVKNPKYSLEQHFIMINE